MRIAALISLFALTLAGQTPPPVHIAYECSEEDVDAFGLNCASDEPCPVFAELSFADSAAGKLFVGGNLHTRNVTLFGILLASEDGGLSWTEPVGRIRSAALEQIEFLNPQTGWVSGESIDPLARNPFLLMTLDGGKNWRKKAIFEDTKVGSIAQFHFDSAGSGEIVIDASQGKTIRQELYSTMTAGESWEEKEVSNVPIRMKSARAATDASLRVRADQASGTFRLERVSGQRRETVASFEIHVADCK